MVQYGGEPIRNGWNRKRRDQCDHAHKYGILDLILPACIPYEPAKAIPKPSTRGLEP
jgi:hypothetical protein